MKRLAVAALIAVVAMPALAAEECTEEKAEALSSELFAMIEEEPARAERMEASIAEIEKEYGGEPTPEQTCDALVKLMAKIKAGD